MTRLLILTSFALTLSGTCQHEQKPVEQREPSPLLYFFGDCMTGPDWPLRGSWIRGFGCYTYGAGALSPNEPISNEPISGPCGLLDVDGDGDIDLKDLWRLQHGLSSLP